MDSPMIGFTCAYTPLWLISAAGFSPYRVLPLGEWPDQAGHILHDNMCPHVKRIVDRALAGDIPENLAGMVFANSCDTMRRAADAWRRVRPNDPTTLLDMPVTSDGLSKKFFAGRIRALARTLETWSGKSITDTDLASGVAQYNLVAGLLGSLREQAKKGALAGGSARLQTLYNQASTRPWGQVIPELEKALEEPEETDTAAKGVPVFLFGNVLPDPQAYAMLEECGARVAGDDFCTSERMFYPLEPVPSGVDPYVHLAGQMLENAPCGRTFDPARPGGIAHDVLARARQAGARGVIGHTIKFCDPYLARLPMVREVLTQAEMPLLILEGDCTLRSMGQQRTRIEAFVEMLA